MGVVAQRNIIGPELVVELGAGLAQALPNEAQTDGTSAAGVRQVQGPYHAVLDQRQVAILTPGLPMKALACAEGTCASPNSATQKQRHPDVDIEQGTHGSDAFAFHQLTHVIGRDDLIALGQQREAAAQARRTATNAGAHTYTYTYTRLGTHALRHRVAKRHAFARGDLLGHKQGVVGKVEGGADGGFRRSWFRSHRSINRHQRVNWPCARTPITAAPSAPLDRRTPRGGGRCASARASRSTAPAPR